MPVSDMQEAEMEIGCLPVSCGLPTLSSFVCGFSMNCIGLLFYWTVWSMVCGRPYLLFVDGLPVGSHIDIGYPVDRDEVKSGRAGSYYNTRINRMQADKPSPPGKRALYEENRDPGSPQSDCGRRGKINCRVAAI